MQLIAAVMTNHQLSAEKFCFNPQHKKFNIYDR